MNKIVTIIDYGMGNIGSIVNMIKKIGHESRVASEADQLADAEKLILPGVGAFDQGIENLKELNMIPILRRKITEEKRPILGICLGMQLMTAGSEEGISGGLGFIDARTQRFSFTNSVKLPIPHMGWNTVKVEKNHALFDGMGNSSQFYFVHSYYVLCNNLEDILLTSQYGLNFTSAYQRENIYGVQFHPEKSHKYGMQLLRNFIEKC